MKSLFALAATLTLAASMAQAATISTIDTIDDATRDHFYGFEDLPSTGSFGATTGSTTTGDNITVTQVNGETNDIWTTYLPGGGEGARAWYANGGDFGYTAIKTADGSDLDALGLLIGSGYNSDTTGHYSLRLDGSEVSSGSFVNSGTLSYLSFSGARFDEIYLLATLSSSFSSFGDGTFNALAVDAIEVSLASEISFSSPTPIPLPAGGLLLLSGLVGIGVMRRFKRG
ncbi:MAG: VPLPA-CTERM sorting domain-containing protein [Paracoccaceae bacterium]